MPIETTETIQTETATVWNNNIKEMKMLSLQIIQHYIMFQKVIPSALL